MTRVGAGEGLSNGAVIIGTSKYFNRTQSSGDTGPLKNAHPNDGAKSAFQFLNSS